MKCFLPILCACLMAGSAQARIWTSVTGKMFEADMVKASTSVVLLRIGSATHKVSLDKLSKEDQAYILEKLGKKMAEKKDAPVSNSTEELAAKAKETMERMVSEKAEIETIRRESLAAKQEDFRQKVAERRKNDKGVKIIGECAT